jgi:hypothetical protein
VLATETNVSLAGGAETTVIFENVATETVGEFNHTVASEDDAATGSLTGETASDGGDGGTGDGGGATSVAFLVCKLPHPTPSALRASVLEGVVKSGASDC